MKKMTTIGALLALSLVGLSACASDPEPVAVAPEQMAQSGETTTARVFFLSKPNLKAGIDPILLSVDRTVSKVRPAHGVMDAMFQGPKESEKAAGLMMVNSGITGYHGLRIEGGIATITLEGNCRNGGSSVTIADLITASLKQFPSVLHVRIYDENGQTQNPNGPGDSIPACLVP